MNPLMELEEQLIQHNMRWNMEGASARKDEDGSADSSMTPLTKFQPYPFPRLKRHQLMEIA